MTLTPLGRIGPLRRMIVAIARWRVEEKLREITPLLGQNDRILDIGAGNGVLCDALARRGHSITPLDVQDASFLSSVRPIVYNGRDMPFADQSFDVALIVTVLHHAPDPDRVLAEARRVAPRVIVIEEVITGPVNKFFTFAIDSFFNLEFVGHPRTNRSDSNWQRSFDRLGLKLLAVRQWTSLGLLRRATYSLERQATVASASN